MQKQLKDGIRVYFVVCILILLAAIGLKIFKKDFMDLVIFRSKILDKFTCHDGGYSLWPISHFLMYLTLGFIAPDYWQIWYICGILWEYIEISIGKIKIGFLQNLVAVRDSKGESQYRNEWISGCFGDLIFNGAGLLLGVIISWTYKKTYIRKKSENFLKKIDRLEQIQNFINKI